VREKNIALLSSVSGIGKKTAERLALELGDKVDEFVETPPGEGRGSGAPLATGAEAALKALERLGYASAEADRALRRALSGDGGSEVAGETETLVRRALQILTAK
jgi:Holliday junction DNA helicase RuvA